VTDSQPWQNRIVGQGVKPASEFLANPRNFRTHPPAQRAAVAGSLAELGWIQTVIENIRTGNLIDGHERIWQALQHGDAPVPFVQVDLSEQEEALALAVFDPISTMAGTDPAKLDELLREVSTGEAALQEMLANLAESAGLDYGGNGQPDESYSRNVEAPIYTPKGDKPKVADLFDDTKARALMAEIDATDLPEEEKDFLRVAARRHTVLNYKRIADYYAHSDATVQALMENSALVIIDFKRAIELGYVKLSQEIAEQYGIDYADA
jgi:hypothetical protein